MKGHVSKDMTLNERALPPRYIYGTLICNQVVAWVSVMKRISNGLSAS
jgi:hypothetical protein